MLEQGRSYNVPTCQLNTRDYKYRIAATTMHRSNVSPCSKMNSSRTQGYNSKIRGPSTVLLGGLFVSYLLIFMAGLFLHKNPLFVLCLEVSPRPQFIVLVYTLGVVGVFGALFSVFSACVIGKRSLRNLVVAILLSMILAISLLSWSLYIFINRATMIRQLVNTVHSDFYSTGSDRLIYLSKRFSDFFRCCEWSLCDKASVGCMEEFYGQMEFICLISVSIAIVTCVAQMAMIVLEIVFLQNMTKKDGNRNIPGDIKIGSSREYDGIKFGVEKSQPRSKERLNICDIPIYEGVAI